MNVVIIDGQGGRLGRMLVEAIAAAGLDCRLTAVGTNSIATAAMLRAGAPSGATGENPVLVAARDADVIIGPLGLLVADALLGEITPAMAQAVGQSRAVKLLLPVNMCNNRVVGVGEHSFSELVNSAVRELAALLES
ncbi:MAG: DUF3842 family protein [Firmicutes bacterium]|nr:DUF3842 family protein [Bacillota bacterium]